jgi:hypothetical protein
MNTKTLERRFSVERVGLLLRNRIYEEAPVIGIGAAVIFALNLLTLWGSHQPMLNAPRLHGVAWIAVIVIGGLLLAGGAFKGMHDGKAGTDWILLPATPLEKYVAALADSAVVYPIAASAVCAAMSALLALLARLFGVDGGELWLPLDSRILLDWADYAIATSVLLAGSASFRKIPLLKTIGVGSAFFLVMIGLIALGVRAFFGPDGGAATHMSYMNGSFNFDGSKVSQRAQDVVRMLFDIARYAILPAFAILFGVAKVIEKEGRDEVQ